MILAIVSNADWFFLSHRLPIARAALERGDEVWLLAKDTGRKGDVEHEGIHFVDIPFERSGTNPLHEAKCVILLLKAYRRIRPDVIHHVTIKAALLGSTAARLGGFPHVVNAISGMGYAFTDGRHGLLQHVMKSVMNFAFRKASYAFILQNPDDRATILARHFVPDDHVFLIKGSGIDLGNYRYVPPQAKEKLEILFPARILKDKGVMEFIDAARLLRPRFGEVARFVLVGGCDEFNPSVLPPDELNALLIPGYLEWEGFQSQMRPFYESSDIVCLPSYREGLPKSLIEACAVGRPIVTTDVPGCRECVVNGYNGWLVTPKDAADLAEKIARLLDSQTDRETFGRHSRLLAEREFSIDDVVARHLTIYDFLMKESG